MQDMSISLTHVAIIPNNHVNAAPSIEDDVSTSLALATSRILQALNNKHTADLK